MVVLIEITLQAVERIFILGHALFSALIDPIRAHSTKYRCNIHVLVALEEVSGFAFAKLGVAKFTGRGGSAKGEVGSFFVAVCNALI